MSDSKVISKISNTLEEIRDILLGKSSSKLYNSIQTIASTNISINDLMEELVDTTKKSSVASLSNSNVNNIGSKNKIIESANKTLTSIKDILSDISNDLSSIFKKSKFNISRDGDKKVIDKIIKNAEDVFKGISKSGKDSKILSMINVVSKLKEIKFSDIITSRKKIETISKVYDRISDIFNKIKDKGIDVDEINKFALNSIDVAKKLSKISLLSKPAEVGAKAIDKIFLGKFGLINTIEKMYENKDKIKESKKITNDLLILSGKMFLITLLMTGVMALGIPAMGGALLMSGVVLVFGLTFAAIGLLKKPIEKGNNVAQGMMTSMILAGAGLFLINKSTKDLEWEQLGKAGVAILEFGLIASILGIPVVAAAVGLGSLALAGLGLSLVAIGGGIALFDKLVSDSSIDKVSEGIPKVFGAITSIFKDQGGRKDEGFGDSFMSIVMGGLRVGGVMFASAALIMVGISLGFLGLSLRSWESFNIKAIDNVTYAIEKLDDSLGLGLKENRHEKSGFTGMISDGFGLISTLFQAGKTFFGMASILISTVVLGIVKNSIEKWSNFDSSSLDNIDTAITKLDDIFGLGIKKKSSNEIVNLGTSIVDSFGNFFGLGAALLNCGGAMVKLGTLSIAVGVTNKIVESIRKWKNFNSSPLDNVLSAVKKFGNFFGISFDSKSNEEGTKGFLSNLANGILNAGRDVAGSITGTFGLASTLIQSGSQFMKLGVLTTAVGVVDKLTNVMIKAGKNSSIMKNSLNSTFDAFDKMIEYFFNDDRLDTSMWDNLKSVGIVGIGGLLAGPIGMLGASLISTDSRKTKLSILTTSVGIVDKMADAIIKMGKYSGDVKSGLATTFEALDLMTDYLFGDAGTTKAGALGRIKSAMNNSKTEGFFGLSDGSDEVETQLEVLTSCVGIIGTMSTALKNMKEMSPDISTSIDNVFYTLEKISDYFFDDADENSAGALSKIGTAMKNAKSDGGFFSSLFGDGSSEINTRLEILVGCIGIVSQISDVIKTMSDKKDVDSSIKTITTSLDDILDYFKKYDEDTLDNIEDIADEFPDIIKYIVEIIDEFDIDEKQINTIKTFSDVAIPSLSKIIDKLSLYKESKLKNINEVSNKLPGIFKNLSWTLDYMKGDYEQSFDNIKKLCESIGSFNLSAIRSMYGVGVGLDKISNSLIHYSKNTNLFKMKKMNTLINQFTNLSRFGSPVMFDSVSNVIDKINTIDIEKAQALTDTFKSFNKINSFGGFMINFKRQVGLFTSACVRLIDAINGNTDALTSENLIDDSNVYSDDNKEKSISISNVKELAELIANSINGNYNSGGFADAIPVELKINGEGGDTWVIRRY